MKLTPVSRALLMMRDERASSVGPPNIIVPRQIGEILSPERPRLRYSIMCSSRRRTERHILIADLQDAIKLRTLSAQARASSHPFMIVAQLALLRRKRLVRFCA